MIFIIAASLSFFLVFVLVSKKGKSTADKILSAWMFVLGTHLLLHFTEYSGLILKYPFLEGVNTPFPLLHGPLMYLYARALTADDNRLNRWEILHMLPPLLVVIYMIPFFTLSGADKVKMVETLANQGSVFLTIVLYSYMISGIAYITLSLILLRQHRKKLVLNFSNIDRINLNWLRYLIIGMIVIWSIVTVGYILDDAFGMQIGNVVDTMIFSAVSAFILMIGYFGIKQTTIFSGQTHLVVHSENLPVTDDNETSKTRYKKSGLSQEQGDDLQTRLKALMNEKKPHLDDTLTLKSLAEKLGFHPNYVSQVINERFNKNFYDFINTARVDEFKLLIQESRSQHLTLLALAFECGFSSKSSFNKFFKRSTGQTPSEYIQAQKK